MAKELNYYGELEQTGLTVTSKVYDKDGTQIGGDIACYEVSELAIYIADMPTADYGEYGVRFFNGTELLGQSFIHWSGSKEIIFDSFDKITEIHQIQGLDIGNPLVTTENSMESGDVKIEITGNGETLSEFTRQ
jgi:hypothetical protein